VARAGERLGLGLEATVAALAGPTGSGKSSLFNALAGHELSTVGRRRPTTSTASAAVWGDGADALLDWLEVPRRHRLDGDGAFDGLVLLDLPDFDSVERAHRLEVDRIVSLADLLVWVVDPQKYADAALHDDYLRRFAAHGAVTVVLLNQADGLDPAAADSMRSDLATLVEKDGLEGVRVQAVSARTGDGLEELRRLLASRVAAREAAVGRLAADLSTVAARLSSEVGEGSPRGIGRAARDRLLAALEQAAGLPAVVLAVERSHRRRGALATGWPLVRWLLRLRPDPLRRLRLGGTPKEAARTSLPGPTPVQLAQVSAALRTLAAEAADGLEAPWPSLVRSAATVREAELADRLDRAVAGADLRRRDPRWWTPVRGLQTLLAAAAAVGLLWLLALAAFAFLQLDDVVPVPELDGLSLPTFLLLGGLVAGLFVAFLARLANGVGARRRANAARRALRGRVADVAAELVVDPVERELEVPGRLRDTLAVAGGAKAPGRRRRAPVAAPAG
jgi:GTP-binding protein EngB required for normal cell division